MKIGKIILIICVLVSFALYCTSTSQYSYSLSILCMTIYLLSSIITIVNNAKIYDRLTMFITAFAFSFLVVNYFYPVFFYLEAATIKIFQFEFAENAIQKSTYLATLGGTVLNLGLYEDRTSRMRTYSHYDIKIYNWEVGLMILLSAAYFFFNRNLFTSDYSDATIGGGTITSVLGYSILLLYYLIFKDLYICGEKTNSFIGYLKKGNKMVMISALLITLAWIFIGKRVIAMRVALVFLFAYAFFIKKIGFAKFVTIAILGMLVLFVSGIFRDNKTGLSSDAVAGSMSVQNAAYYGVDLAINSRSLYELVDYTDKNGCNYGSTMISDVASIVPKMQSVVLNVFGLPLYHTSSAYLVTWLYFGADEEYETGLGTNLVGDVYISFGLLGVILLFFILGRLIRKTERECTKGNFKYLLLYVIFISDVIFYPRASFLSPMRNLIWIWIIYLLDVNLNKQKKWHAS